MCVIFRLSYYTADSSKKLKGEFNTRDCVVNIVAPNSSDESEYSLKGKSYAFVIKREASSQRDSIANSTGEDGGSRVLVLEAESEELRQWWVNHLRCRIEEARYAPYDDFTENRASISAERPSEMVKHNITGLNNTISNQDTSPVNTLSNTSNNNTSVIQLYANTVWQQFIYNSDEYIVYTSEVIKKNKYGMSQKRQLILTNALVSRGSSVNGAKGFRLFYVDGSSMKVKGVIEGKNENQRPLAEMVR
jgi:hypothetical protein